MEVTDVDTIPLSHPLEEGRGYGSARGIVEERTTTLVRVESSTGAVGWGEAFGPPRTIATLVSELLSDVVTGMNPFEVESLCERNYTGLYHFGSSGLIQSAVSGIEIALWDLLGKELGQPVSQLLGGTNRTEVTPYASTMYITEWEEEPEAPMEAAADEGFTAAKIKIGRGLEDDIHRVRVAREILGEDAALMVDCNGNYRPEQAIRVATELEAFDVKWLEEPVPPENHSGYREVKAAVEVPVAAGEAAYARFDFEELIRDRTVDIIQPDVCKCGGLSEARLIGKMATVNNVAVSPHVWTGAIGLAASLQYAATLPSYPHSMNIPEPLLFEFDRAPNGLREELLVEPFDPTGATLEIPQEPGLGVELDRDAVETFRTGS
jgi:D-galactarolactone cycloisomerase